MPTRFLSHGSNGLAVFCCPFGGDFVTLRGREAVPMMDMLWQLDGVTLNGWQGARLRDVSVAIPPGVTAVLGQSGAGKTSLLNLLVDFEKPDAGAVRLMTPFDNSRLPVFWVPQDDGLWPHLTAGDHLRMVSDADPAGLLAEFDIADKGASYPDELSEGERARLSVARALASGARVLVMDEPLAHVDAARVGRYWGVMRRHLASTGASLVFSTHLPKTVLGEADHVICLRDGRVIYDGAVDELYWRPATSELADCLGEHNWVRPDEARGWLGRPETSERCYRPEQVKIAVSPDGHCTVVSSRFHGSVAETELKRLDGGQTRLWVHRPPNSGLRSGDRVELEVAS
jgi:ABC-type multidrug transport system ATPase subunit